MERVTPKAWKTPKKVGRRRKEQNREGKKKVFDSKRKKREGADVPILARLHEFDNPNRSEKREEKEEGEEKRFLFCGIVSLF